MLMMIIIIRLYRDLLGRRMHIVVRSWTNHSGAIGLQKRAHANRFKLFFPLQRETKLKDRAHFVASQRRFICRSIATRWPCSSLLIFHSATCIGLNVDVIDGNRQQRLASERFNEAKAHRRGKTRMKKGKDQLQMVHTISRQKPND